MCLRIAFCVLCIGCPAVSVFAYCVLRLRFGWPAVSVFAFCVLCLRFDWPAVSVFAFCVLRLCFVFCVFAGQL